MVPDLFIQLQTFKNYEEAFIFIAGYFGNGCM